MTLSPRRTHLRLRVLWVLLAVFMTASLCSCRITIIADTTDEASSEAAPVSLDDTEKALTQPDTQPAPTAAPSPAWQGAYYYDDGSYGELFLISSSSDTQVRGTYVFAYADGSYGDRAFTWTLSSATDASEPYGNGDGTVTYHLSDDRITAQYPAGWWGERDYLYICELDKAPKEIQHPYFGNQKTASSTAPFYGVWVFAAAERSGCDTIVRELRSKGLSAEVYVTTDWSNLNPEKYYVVSVGSYSTQEAAERALSDVQAAGYTNAYVKYSGEHK